MVPREDISCCFVHVLRHACDEVKGQSGVVGFLEAFHIKILKIHCFAWLPIFFRAAPLCMDSI